MSQTGRKMVTKDNEASAYFQEEYKKWVDEVSLLSTDMFDNEHFRNIVDMDEKAVPFIMDIIKKEPDPIAHALDLIYPNAIEYGGFVTWETVRKLWLNIIKIEK